MSSQSPTKNEGSATDKPLSISKDDLFYLLQNNRRRAVLRYCAAHADYETFEMRTVVEAVAAWENETTIRNLNSSERQRTYVSLYQTHLPTLDEYKVINYNQPRGVIQPTALIALFEPYLAVGFESVPQDQRITLSEDPPSSNFSTIRSLLTH